MSNAREKQTAPFKVGDRVINSGCREAGVGIVLEVLNGGRIRVDYSPSWAGICTAPAEHLVKVVYDSPEYARSLEQEIVVLKAEVSTLKAEWALMNEELASANATTDAEHSALLEARAQLEDIAAIERVNRMVAAIHGTSPDWTFHGLIVAVMEGRAA